MAVNLLCLYVMDIVALILLLTPQRSAYTHYIQSNEIIPGKIVAIAEPNHTRAQLFAKAYNIPQSAVFSHYDEIARLGPQACQADAVVVTRQDAMHLDSVVKFVKLGYHILCEKPMATSLADCKQW